MGVLKDFFHGLRSGAEEFAKLTADAVNLVLLSFVYFVGIGLVSLIAKLAGKHFLNLKPRDTKSYWVKVESGPDKKNSYRMF